MIRNTFFRQSLRKKHRIGLDWENLPLANPLLHALGTSYDNETRRSIIGFSISKLRRLLWKNGSVGFFNIFMNEYELS